MPKEVTLGVSCIRDVPGEYRVFWKEGSRSDESKTYYTQDLVDAGLTLAKVAREAARWGRRVRISKARMTLRALRASAPFAKGMPSEGEVETFLGAYRPDHGVSMRAFREDWTI